MPQRTAIITQLVSILLETRTELRTTLTPTHTIQAGEIIPISRGEEAIMEETMDKPLTKSQTIIIR